MLKRREMAEIYHNSHGHCNNRQTVLNLQAKGIQCNHLKRHILTHRCDACDAAPGRRHHKVKATKKANITFAIDPTVAVTESLARLLWHSSKNPSGYPDITQIRKMSGTAKDPATSGIGETLQEAPMPNTTFPTTRH